MAATNINPAVLTLAIHSALATGNIPLSYLQRVSITISRSAMKSTKHPQNLFHPNQDTLNQLILAAKRIHLLTQAELDDLSVEIEKTGGFDAYLSKLLTIQEQDQEGVLMLLTFLSSTPGISTEQPGLTIACA